MLALPDLPRPGSPAGPVHRLQLPAARPLRPRARRGVASGSRSAAPGPLALSRGAPGVGVRAHRQPGRRHDTPGFCTHARRGTRHPTAPDQGRRPAADGILQGARGRRRRLEGTRARRPASCDADQRQRRSCLGGLRGPGRSRHPGRDADCRADGHSGGDRRHRCRPLARRRAHLRCGSAGGRGRGAQPGQLVRRLDPQRALSHRRQEDDGLRDRGAARLADAGRDRVSDRGRRGPDRHPPGAHRGAQHGLGRR